MMIPINIGASLTFCPALNLQASSLSGLVLLAQLPMSTKWGFRFRLSPNVNSCYLASNTVDGATK